MPPVPCPAIRCSQTLARPHAWAGLLFVLLLLLSQVGVTAERPNVLFIAADDLRNDLACYGHPLAQTPHLDALADDGLLFQHAYCQQALCNPSRASLLTGKRPNTLGIWDLPTHFRDVSPGIVTLPEHFRRHGYFTQNIGKVFHNWRQDDYRGDPASWSVPAVMHYNSHGNDRAMVSGELPQNHARTARTEARDVPDEAYFDGRIAAAAVKALGELQAKDAPFFLAVGFWKPHLPFNPPKPYWDRYDRSKIRPATNSYPPENAPEIAFHNGRELLGRGNQSKALSEDAIIELRHGYLAGISYLDAQVGKLLAELKRLELDKNTIVVFWSDHGFHLGEHALWCKTSNFELDARVPLIISAPGLTAGQETNALVELLDLYPTLVDLCGLEMPAGLEGTSLKPLLVNPQTTVKPAAYTQHPRPAYYKGKPETMGVSVRTEQFRYTEWRNFQTGEVQAAELYDHQQDPDENHNVVGQSKYRPAVAQAKQQLEQVFPHPLKPHIVKHHVEDLTVDLGVGLWAWPLPMDFDGDGDLDLVVNCPDVPHAGVYLFKNPGTGDKMPVFSAPEYLGPKLSNATLSSATPDVLVPGHVIQDLTSGKKTQIYPRTNVHPNRVRANQWRYVDYDGDQILDIIVGVGDWTEYGWDNAFDQQGRWTRGPLRGFVYLLRGEANAAKPRKTADGNLYPDSYEAPRKLTAGGQPIDVYGMPSPNFADFDGDGDLDLLCGEFLDGFTYFQNQGSRKQPRYAAGRRLTHAGRPIRMDLQMICPVAIDWDADGDTDLIVGDEDGRVALVEHTGQVQDGLPRFLPPKYFQQQAQDVKFGALVTPVSYDWDADGDEDLICGNSAGYIAFIENLDGGCPPRWAAPRRLHAGDQVLRVQAGPKGSIQGPCEAKWGYTTLSVADWNHDSLPDLVVNSIWGRVEWYRNIGQPGAPKLAAAQPVRVDWGEDTPPKPAWNWWQPERHDLVTQWRTTPVVVDLDQDGLQDLVMLDHEGYLALFQRKRVKDQLWLTPGQRVFRDQAGEPLRLNAGEAGRSGRRKLCLADWDGDGKLDLLANSKSIDLWRNVSTPDKPWTFRLEGPLDDRRLAGHTTSPTVVDWNRDHRPELLIGAEDGRLYYQPNQYQAPEVTTTPQLKIETRHVQSGVLDNDAVAYANRSYVWFDVPQPLRGWRTTQTYGGEPALIAVTAREATTVYMATSRSIAANRLPGWERVEDWTFGYTDGGKTKMQVLRRKMKAGERTLIPQLSWTGGILLLPPE